jgi:hypothetical protein
MRRKPTATANAQHDQSHTQHKRPASTRSYLLLFSVQNFAHTPIQAKIRLLTVLKGLDLTADGASGSSGHAQDRAQSSSWAYIR